MPQITNSSRARGPATVASETTPIIVNGFSRGGTTILTNLLASHPDVCMVGETHHAFKGHRLKDSVLQIACKCALRDLPMQVLTRQDFFSPRLLRPRTTTNYLVKRLIRHVLRREAVTATHPAYNRYKAEGVVYHHDELKSARLLAKNVDGMVYTSELLAEIYPHATFFSLVRHGLAVCEGHLRRGRSARESGRRYQQIVDHMLHLNDRLENHQILRFEDLIEDIPFWCSELAKKANLDPKLIGQLRMQARRVIDENGEHQLVGPEKEWNLVWLGPDKLDSYFNPDVNKNQIRLLDPKAKEDFLSEASRALQTLGYAGDGSTKPTRSPNIWTLTEPDYPATVPFRKPMGHPAARLDRRTRRAA